MENQDLDIPSGFEHLFPGPQQRLGKKRSSILKQLDGNTEFGRDERRSIKRVSFAQHTHYQEVFPDGTISCVEKQLKAENIVAKGFEPGNENPVSVEMTPSTLYESETIEVNEERRNKIATAFKNHMERNYNIDDDKDYDTLYNTSVNKYGREIIPRDEKANVTQLFQGIDGCMQIDSHHSVTLNSTKAFLIENTNSRMSLVDSKLTIGSDCGLTNVVDCKSMELTSQQSLDALEISDSNSNQIFNKSFSFPLNDIISPEKISETDGENVNVVEISTVTSTPPLSQEVCEVKSDECCEDDMECCSSSDDTDTCSESNIESEGSTKILDDTMDVCSGDCENVETGATTELSTTKSQVCSQTKMSESQMSTQSVKEDQRRPLVNDEVPVEDINNHDCGNDEANHTMEVGENLNFVVEDKEQKVNMSDKHVVIENSLNLPPNAVVEYLHGSNSQVNHSFAQVTEVSRSVNDVVENAVNAVCENDELVNVRTIQAVEEKEEEMSKSSCSEKINSESINTNNSVSSKNVTDNQTTSSIALKSQSSKLNILAKIQLPVSTIPQSDKNSQEISSRATLPTFSFLLPTNQTKTFDFKAKTQFSRVSRIPKATINTRPSNILPSANIEVEAVDNHIENDWHAADISEVQPSKAIAEAHSIRPRLRKSFGFSIQEKLQQKREEIESKRNTHIESETLQVNNKECDLESKCKEPNASVNEINLSKLSQSKELESEYSSKVQLSILNKEDTLLLMAEELDQQFIDVDYKNLADDNSLFQTSINVSKVALCDTDQMQNITNQQITENFMSVIPVETPNESSKRHNNKRKRDSSENSQFGSELECNSSKAMKEFHESMMEIITENDNIKQTEKSCRESNSSSNDSKPTMSMLNDSSWMNESEKELNDDSLYDAFEKEYSINSSMNPFQFSFINKDDTLMLMAEELDQTFSNVPISNKTSTTVRLSEESKYPDCFKCLEKLDSKWMSECNIQIEVLSEEHVSVSFCSGIFLLDIHLEESTKSLKNITELKTSFRFDSLLRNNDFIALRKDFIFDFRNEHKGLLIPVNFMVASLFEDMKSELMQKYPTSANLDQLISDGAQIMFRSEQLLMELRSLSAFHRFLFRKVDDNFEFVFVIRGVCRNIYLALGINVKQYPYEITKPGFGIHPSERHRYKLKSFTGVLQDVPTGEKYITRLVKSAKIFVKAMKKVEIENKCTQ